MRDLPNRIPYCLLIAISPAFCCARSGRGDGFGFGFRPRAGRSGRTYVVIQGLDVHLHDPPGQHRVAIVPVLPAKRRGLENLPEVAREKRPERRRAQADSTSVNRKLSPVEA